MAFPGTVQLVYLKFQTLPQLFTVDGSINATQQYIKYFVYTVNHYIRNKHLTANEDLYHNNFMIFGSRM